MFCCWKCGSGTHIGDKCRDHTRTFEEVFNGSVTDIEFEKPTWAAVVRSGQGDDSEQRQRTKDFEAKLKADNKRRDSEQKEIEERLRVEKEEAGRQKRVVEEERKKVIDDVERKARELNAGKVDADRDSANCFNDVSAGDDDDSLLVRAAGVIGVTGVESSDSLSEAADPEAEARDRALLTAIKHKSWLEARSVRDMMGSGVHLNLSLNKAQELERIFGPGAAQQQLALEYQAGNKNDGEDVDNESDQERNTTVSIEDTGGEVVDDENMSDESVVEDMKTSTPTREPRGKKRLNKSGFNSSISLSPVRNISDESAQLGSAESKKLRFDKDDTVYEGEGDTVPIEGVDSDSQMEGDTVHEGEGDIVPQGDVDGEVTLDVGMQVGEISFSGDRLVEQQRNESTLSSIREFWEHEASLQSDPDLFVGKEGNSSHGGDKSPGASETVLPPKSPGKGGEGVDN